MTDSATPEREAKRPAAAPESSAAAQSAQTAPEPALAAATGAVETTRPHPTIAEASEKAGARTQARISALSAGRVAAFAEAVRRLRPSARGRRLAAQAATVALIAGSGAMLGSFGFAAIERALGNAVDACAEATQEAQGIRSELAQLRAQIKTANDQVASLRTSLTNASAASNAQFAKLSEALERLDKRVAHAPAPEVTGSLVRPQAAAPLKPVPGWTVRRVLNGIALIESRDGLVEAEPGDHLPGLGRVQDIKRENGRWVVVTSRGLVTSR